MKTTHSEYSYSKGFTLIELLLVMAVASILMGIATMSLGSIQSKSQLDATANTLLADMKEQQIKAMVGDRETGAQAAAYGIRFGTGTYTVFRDAYGTGNYIVELPESIQISETIAGDDLIFERGSGNVANFDSGSANTITLQDIQDGSQKVITINRYGVVTGISN